MTRLTRRQFLEVAAATPILVASGGVLAACAAGSAGGSASSPAAPPFGKPLATASEIPAGGGKILSGDHVVITQPSPGVFKAFSATCTHQGCTVGQVTGGVIKCPCHGSEFSAVDGSVEHGPATQRLAEYQVRLEGDSITLSG